MQKNIIFILAIKTNLKVLYIIPQKKQFIYFKKSKKLFKQRKIEIKSNILIENTSILLDDKSIEGL